MNDRRNKSDILITLWIAFGASIILGFFVFSMIIGGSASAGYYQNGQYFVGEHEKIVEVSKTIYMVSSVWEVLFFIFIPLTPIGAFTISNVIEKIKNRKNRME